MNQKTVLILDALDAMITKMEEMPQEAMYINVTQYDHYTLLVLLAAGLRSLFDNETEKNI